MTRWTPATITAWRFARLLKATYWNVHLLVSWIAQDLRGTKNPVAQKGRKSQHHPWFFRHPRGQQSNVLRHGAYRTFSGVCSWGIGMTGAGDDRMLPAVWRSAALALTRGPAIATVGAPPACAQRTH